METMVISKMGRFIELSKKFSKTEVEVFGKSYDYSSYNITSGLAGVYRAVDYGHSIKAQVTPTRTEVIKQELEETVKLSEEFEEFLKLRSELENYCSSVEKLNK